MHNQVKEHLHKPLQRKLSLNREHPPVVERQLSLLKKRKLAPMMPSLSSLVRNRVLS